MQQFEKLREAILTGDAELAVAAVEEAIEAGADPVVLISGSMIPAMDEVGKLFEEEEYFVPELLMAGQAMKAAMAPLRPMLLAVGAKPAGTIVIGTVEGDLHDIGKNLVVSMLEGGGFQVHDLGTDVPPEKIVEAVRTHRPQVLCLSALLTVTMPAMRTTIDALASAGLRDQVKVLVGGAPVNQQYAREIGADAYGATANEAVALSRKIIGKAD